VNEHEDKCSITELIWKICVSSNGLRIFTLCFLNYFCYSKLWHFLNAHVLILCSQIKCQRVTDRNIWNQLAVLNLFLPAAFIRFASVTFIDITKYVLMLFYICADINKSELVECVKAVGKIYNVNSYSHSMKGINCCDRSSKFYWYKFQYLCASFCC
jgi:hypothetical protein